MAKVLLVEDDNNLREIYEARLQAEGYEIAAAQDGEQALVVAKDFKPDLVISDVMMPKISGFEMLDILRNTEGLEHTRVIMLTALSQAEDKSRADSLGADRYLVKSQVTLEDIIKAAHDILGDGDAQPSAATTTQAAPTPATDVAVATPPAAATAVPVAVAPAPVAEPVQPAPAATDATPVQTPAVQPTPAPAPDPSQTQDDQLLASAENSLQQSTGVPITEPAAPTAPAPAAETNQAQPPSGGITPDSSGGSSKRVIQPVTDDNSVKPTLEELLAREEAKEISGTTAAPASPNSAPATPDSATPPPATPPQSGQTNDFNPHDISL